MTKKLILMKLKTLTGKSAQECPVLEKSTTPLAMSVQC